MIILMWNINDSHIQSVQKLLSISQRSYFDEIWDIIFQSMKHLYKL